VLSLVNPVEFGVCWKELLCNEGISSLSLSLVYSCVASHLCQELVPECLHVLQARVLERTPSLSELNEIMYGQV
jgi:hypothetical protein